ncbi:MAG: hypothetical protein QM730_13960 [Anaerolineales bacterium]
MSTCRLPYVHAPPTTPPTLTTTLESQEALGRKNLKQGGLAAGDA